MKKTNLRINNCFIFLDKNKYFLTDIDVLDVWKKTSDKELKDFSKSHNDITEKIEELINKFNIRSNVNFIIEDFEKFKKSKEVLSEKRIIIKKGGLNKSL